MEPLQPGLRPPLVIAHRGSSATQPENTTPAFDAALADGCDGIELDVQLSRDGVPVVYHDRTLHKVGGGRRRVSRVDAAELLGLDAGGWFAPRFRGARIPTLERVLRRYGRRTRLLVELKARPRDRAEELHLRLAATVGAMLRTLGLERRVLLLSFDADSLSAAPDRSPRVRTVLNLEAPRRMTAALRRRLVTVFALSVDVRTITPAIVRAAHELGRPVLAYTCNSTRAVARALDAGADGLMSDRPGWLRERIAAREDAR